MPNAKSETARPSATRPEWAAARRIVVKIGSALLVDRATGVLKSDWLASTMDDVAALAVAALARDEEKVALAGVVREAVVDVVAVRFREALLE